MEQFNNTVFLNLDKLFIYPQGFYFTEEASEASQATELPPSMLSPTNPLLHKTFGISTDRNFSKLSDLQSLRECIVYTARSKTQVKMEITLILCRDLSVLYLFKCLSMFKLDRSTEGCHQSYFFIFFIYI